MPKARLIFDGREFYLGSGVATIGRAPDNSVSFPDDSNVSRNHVEIEQRGDYYCLVDLGSSNGTTVNGQRVEGEIYLWDGAKILLGGSAEVIVQFADESGDFAELPADGSAPGLSDAASSSDMATAQSASAIAAEQPVGSKKMLLAAGGVFGLAVVFAGGAGILYYSSSSACNAKAVIVSPEPGDTLSTPTEIEVDVSNGGCVARAAFTIDGIEFASTDEIPFTATIDPNDFPEFADGYDHGLAIVLEDEEGNRIEQNEPVMLAFETKSITKPRDAVPANIADPRQTPPEPKAESVTLIEINEMSKRFLKQFPASSSYSVSNKQFLLEIQKKTAEYAQPGYYDRAARYRDAINVAFVREQNLDAPLGFVLAMSRSRFVPDKQGNDEGLWRMTSEFASSNGYTGLCGTETLAEASQNCAAKAASLYMKALVFGVFDGDVIYSVGAFGKSPQDASVWKSTLPANRTDIWNSIKTAPEREQIVRFFAAGIVAENPQKFGLKSERQLSELFRLAL